MVLWLPADPTDPRLAAAWPGSADLPADQLAFLLESARVQCEAYAPPLQAGTVTAPANYLHAQALQARALSNSGEASPGDAMGGYGDTVTVFPMDWTVKLLLRPQHPTVIV